MRTLSLRQSSYLLADLTYLSAIDGTLGWSATTSCGNIAVCQGYGIFLDLFAQESNAFLDCCGILIVAYRDVDWLTKPYISIGFLYLFPIMLIAGFLPRWQIIVVALVCAVLQEVVQRTSFERSHHAAANGFCWICWNGALYFRNHSQSPDGTGARGGSRHSYETPSRGRGAASNSGG